MLRAVCYAFLLTLFAAFNAAAQSRESAAVPTKTASEDTAAQPGQTKKPKKVYTNEDVAGSKSPISVVGNPKNTPKPATTSKLAANGQYVASVRKQMEKLQDEIGDIQKQLTDLKNFNAGEPSTNASGVRLDKSYQREPIEVQMRALEQKKKDLESKLEALLDEARKKGVDSSQLR